MLEIYLDKRGEAAIENIEDLLKAFPRYADRAVASALRELAVFEFPILCYHCLLPSFLSGILLFDH